MKCAKNVLKKKSNNNSVANIPDRKENIEPRDQSKSGLSIAKLKSKGEATQKAKRRAQLLVE